MTRNMRLGEKLKPLICFMKARVYMNNTVLRSFIEVVQVDSKNSPAFQRAYVMICAALEATNTLASHRSGERTPDELLEHYDEHHIIHILSDLDFVEQQRFQQGVRGGEIINYFAAHFGGRGGSG